MNHKVGDVWYRYEAVLTSSGVDEFDEPVGPGFMALHSHKYDVVKVTPKGVRISFFGGVARLVLHNHVKKYAHPSREEALKSFICRKNSQKGILLCQISRCEEAKRNAERLLAKMSEER